jgi:hypothetical protein
MVGVFFPARHKAVSASPNKPVAQVNVGYSIRHQQKNDLFVSLFYEEVALAGHTALPP